MLLGEWWVANPTDAAEAYKPPDPADRVPGTLREVGHGEFALETIGFLGDRPFAAGVPPTASDRSGPEIWGTDRDSTCYCLFDNLRSNTTWSFGHVSEGHEDWRVGWLTRGNAWVTSSEECDSARIQIDDLRAWALHRQPSTIEFDDTRDTATIDLRRKTLGTTTIGDTTVSLVRGFDYRFRSPDQDPDQHFSYANVVYWKVQGPVKLQALVTDWIGHLESFIRFMTMEPSVVSRIDCHLGDTDSNRRRDVELVAPWLPRDAQADQPAPHKYLTTLITLQQRGIDPMEVLAGFWQQVATGDAYMSMALHLESQDRLLARGSDSALLNAVRSVESLYAAHNPGVDVEHVSVRHKIEDAVSGAGDVGTQILDAWPELEEVGKLRRDAAHGRALPDAYFGLRCVGGAMALQWIQRVRLLAELGVSDADACSIVSDNFQYSSELQTLQSRTAELGEITES